MYLFLLPILTQFQAFISSMDPAYLDIIKIFAGSIGWVGGLTLFMWWKEKNKKPVPSFVQIENN